MEPILNIETTFGVERRTIRINGAEYELRHATEFPPVDVLRIEKYSARVAQANERINAADDVSDADGAVLLGALDWLVDRIVIAPPEVLGLLRLEHKFAIVMAFSHLQRQPARTAPEGPTESATAPIGETPSPA